MAETKTISGWDQFEVSQRAKTFCEIEQGRGRIWREQGTTACMNGWYEIHLYLDSK